MEMILSIGVVGSVASIMSVLIAAPNLKSRFIHLGYALFITVLAAAMFHYQLRLREYDRAERQANAILKTAEWGTTGSMAGFMLASLSFLEKNREYFPDTYARAVKLCDTAACADYSAGSTNEYQHFLRMQDASSAMKYLMEGIAAGGIQK